MRLQRGRRPPAYTGFGGSGGDRRGWCSSVCGPPSSASAVVLGPGLLCPVDVSRVSAQCQLGEPTQVWTLEKGKRRWALGGPASSRTRGLGPGHRARDTALDKRVPGSGSTAARVGFPGVVVSHYFAYLSICYKYFIILKSCFGNINWFANCTRCYKPNQTIIFNGCIHTMFLFLVHSH